MNLINYSGYATYNIRSYFSNKPKEIIHCPMCRSDLERMDVKPSRIVNEALQTYCIPIHHFSHLYTCEKCKWWCVRESWGEGEAAWEYDYFIAGITKRWDLSDKKDQLSKLRKYIDRKQKKLSFNTLDRKKAMILIEEYSKAKWKYWDMFDLGIGKGKDDTDIYFFLIRENTDWLIMVSQMVDERSQIVNVVELVNGILACDGQPTGMITTSIDLFTENLITSQEKKQIEFFRETYSKSENPEYRDYYRELRREIIENKRRDSREVHTVKLHNNAEIQSLFEKVSGGQIKPWEIALNDKHLYDNQLNLPKEFGSLFIGGKKKEL